MPRTWWVWKGDVLTIIIIDHVSVLYYEVTVVAAEKHAERVLNFADLCTTITAVVSIAFTCAQLSPRAKCDNSSMCKYFDNLEVVALIW